MLYERAEDIPYELEMDGGCFALDMWGLTIDSSMAPFAYQRNGGLLAADHILCPGFAGKLLRWKRISGSLNFEATFTCGEALLIYTGRKWIASLRGLPDDSCTQP